MLSKRLRNVEIRVGSEAGETANPEELNSEVGPLFFQIFFSFSLRLLVVHCVCYSNGSIFN